MGRSRVVFSWGHAMNVLLHLAADSDYVLKSKACCAVRVEAGRFSAARFAHRGSHVAQIMEGAAHGHGHPPPA